jgi:predicted ATPase
MPVADEMASVIRTPDQRLRVFVSSTLGELALERKAVRAAIERLHLIPVMFELGARPHPPAQLYRAYLDQSHVFLGIYWQRYGWIAPGETVSGLEDEFVRSAGMPRLMYIKEPAQDREAALVEMLGRLADEPDSSYRHFVTSEELAALVEADLAILLTERFEASQTQRGLAARPPSRSLPPALSVPLTPTVGRDRDIESVASLIRAGARLVTITGVGGVGKTRVASEVVRALQREFEEVRFVRLGDLVDPGLVLATIAAAMGVPVERTQSALDAVAAATGEDRLLVALDNLEQLVDVGPDLAELLDRCPGLHLVITSRHVLRLRGEREYPLAPFDVPEPSVSESPDAIARLEAEPAVKLFVEHAQAARPTFRLDSSNARPVAELCRRLDGLPLAIELVATHIRLFPPEDLLERFGDRLLDLTSGSADLPDRHRTLHATLDWSHRLLDPREQALFARLAVFSGGAALDAVEEVCGGASVGDVLETLASLLEKSLVITVTDVAGGPRVAMLQTVRSYAWERLESTGDLATRARHASWYVSLAAGCDPARQPDATTRWRTLDAELPNVRAAVTWLTEEDDTARLALLASSLWTWFWIRGRMSEGRAWIESLSPRIDSPDHVLETVVAAQLCAAVGAVRFSLGDYDTATELFRRALDGFDAADDTGGSAQVACMLAVIEAARGDPFEAIELAAPAVAKARSLDVPWSLAHALTVLGGLRRCGESVNRCPRVRSSARSPSRN